MDFLVKVEMIESGKRQSCHQPATVTARRYQDEEGALVLCFLLSNPFLCMYERPQRRCRCRLMKPPDDADC